MTQETQGIYVLVYIDGRDMFRAELSLSDERVKEAKRGNMNAQKAIIKAFKGKAHLNIFIKWPKDVNPATGGPLTIRRKADNKHYKKPQSLQVSNITFEQLKLNLF